MSSVIDNIGNPDLRAVAATLAAQLAGEEMPPISSPDLEALVASIGRAVHTAPSTDHLVLAMATISLVCRHLAAHARATRVLMAHTQPPTTH